ncbi:MAG: ABC transporter permease [Planctomycetota bacterium]
MPKDFPDLTIEADEEALRLSGALTFRTAPAFLEAVRKAARSGRGTLWISLQGLQRIDTAGAAVLLEARAIAEAAGRGFELEQTPAVVRDGIEHAGIRTDPLPRPGRGGLRRLLRRGLSALSTAGDYLAFLGYLLAASVRAPFRRRGFRTVLALDQMVRIGINASPLVALCCGLMGLTLALQAAIQLRLFGVQDYVIDLVSMSMTREIGPLLAAVLVAGRSGAAIAAEIGTMRVNEEIDALKSLGVSETDHLVIPRVLGLLVMLPCLTFIADAAGIFGGYMFCALDLRQDPLYFRTWLFMDLHPQDVLTGLSKSVVFAGIIGSLAAFFGLRVKGGGEGVGVAATRAVVASIVLTIVADGALTALFYLVGVLA